MSEPSTTSVERDRWVGRTLDGDFEVLERIGEGAMGRVYRATDTRSGDAVAVKVLHKHLGGDPRVARRFHREAKAARRLSHPNSLTILDFGQAKDGTLYIAMELLEGEDLQTVIDHDLPFTPRRVGFLMGQILAALHEAHGAGIIHRDLKPENVVVCARDGAPDRVTVCDFGMAKIIEAEGRTTAITKDGYVCGTPEYMAPEQAKGEPLDMRADVYAAGVILYHLLTGRVPFKAETALGLITKHIMDPPPPPRQIKPEWAIPRSLEAIALKALSKAPADRYADAKALALAIRVAVDDLGGDADERLGSGPFVGSETPSDPPPALDATAEGGDGPTTAEAIALAVPPPTPTRWIVGFGAALIVFGIGVGLWTTEWAAQDPEEPARPEASAMAAPLAPPVAEPSEAHTSQVSPPATPDGPSVPPIAGLEGAPSETAPQAGAPIDGTPTEAATTPNPSSGASPALRPARRPRPPAHDLDPGREALEAGRAHLLQGNLRAALARLDEAARLRPRDPAVQRELGRAAVRAGDVGRGVASYRRYLALAPDAPDRAVIERIIAQHEG